MKRGRRKTPTVCVNLIILNEIHDGGNDKNKNKRRERATLFDTLVNKNEKLFVGVKGEHNDKICEKVTKHVTNPRSCAWVSGGKLEVKGQVGEAAKKQTFRLEQLEFWSV